MALLVVKNGTFRTVFRVTVIVGSTALLIFLVGLFFRVGRLNRQVESLQRGLRTEIEEQNRLGTLLESNQRTVTGHLQEVRRLLNLSPGLYRFDSTDKQIETGDDTEAGRYRDDLFYRGVDRITTEKELTDLESAIAPVWAVDVEPVLRKKHQGLVLQSAGRLRKRVIDRDGTVWMTITVTPEGTSLSTLTDQTVTVSSLTAIPSVLPDALDAVAGRIETYERGKRSIRSYIQRQETRDTMSERRLLPGPESEVDGLFSQVFLTDLTGDPVFTMTLRRNPLEYTVDGEEASSFDGARHLLDRRIARTDPRTAAQKATGEAIERLQEIVSEPPFQAYLKQRDLTMAQEPRETLDFFMFDLTSREGTSVGAFAVQKQNGEIYLTDKNEIVITRLEHAEKDPLAQLRDQKPTATEDRNRLPDGFPTGFQSGRSPSEGTSILLYGTHEDKADTIMLVYLSPAKTISMISIPRDIWWKQRKLNYYHEIYGSDALTEEIADLIGLPVDGWISVDMYAFIEIIDVLGGIEVTLKEPLVDPSYRVYEDGQWSTLYYKAGTHHLGGVEALRLARSRHTSNDFERALRQQEILGALRDQLNGLHAGNLDRLYGIVQTLAEYVDSSYSVWQLTQIFLAYRNAEIVNRTGLTFDNVLYSTYSNVHLQGLDFDEIDDDFVTGEWILLPRGDDWNVIPWFIEEHLR